MKLTNTVVVAVAAVAAVLALGAGSMTAAEQAAPAPGHAHNTVVAMSANHPAAHTDGNVTCAERNSTCGGGHSSFSPPVTALPAPTALPGNVMSGLPGNVNTGA